MKKRPGDLPSLGLFGVPAGNTSSLRSSCHCCAMGRTAGSLPHRKPNKKEPEGSFLFGTPAGNRTRNGPLGGGCYIHLTTEAYFVIPPGNTSSLRSSCHRRRWGEPGTIIPAILRRCAPRATAGGGANPERSSLLLRRSISCYPAWEYAAALGTLFILQRFAQKGNCFQGGSLKVRPCCPDRSFCRKI